MPPIKPLLIEVVIRSMLNPDEVAQRKTINGRSSSDRKWLSNAAYWAWNNSHSVTTAPVETQTDRA